MFAAGDSRVFELRIYHTFPGKLEALEARFRDHTIAIFNSHKMESVGYWTPAEGEDGAGNTLVYILAFKSREQRDDAWEAFGVDPEWKRVYEDSIADGRLVEKVDSVMMAMTDFSTGLRSEAPGPARLFELRTCIASEGRLSNLDARFRETAIGLFERRGMTSIAYFHPLDEEDGSGATLVYLLAHKDRETRDASWEAFVDDPDWKDARRLSEEETGGSLTIPGEARKQLLVPLDFSLLK